MSVAALPDRRPSPPNALPSEPTSLSLNTNNPFRRTASPNPSATSPVRRIPPASASQERPMSRNPFLDPPSGNTSAPKSEQDPATARLADDIFKEPAAPNRPAPNGPPMRNGPPPLRTGPPPPGHRPSRSGEARNGPRPPMRPRPANGEKPSPEGSDKQRPRRNSDSSIADKEKHDEERRRRERRREREARREKEGRTKDGKPRSSRRPHGLDVIDKLDVTGIYGQGLFHHDGPFDACNPHRNRKNNQRAPMHAFPENSANNAMGGGAPQRFDYDRFHGRGEEGFNDFASSGQDYTTNPVKRERPQDKLATLIDPTGRGEQIHGSESHGLGTSTFLEGAPAPRSAIQRRESENEVTQLNSAGPGLGRKKSLAMRIRGLSQPRRPGELSNGRVTSPDGYGPKSPESPPPSATQSAGGPIRARPMGQETNPFFSNDHDDAYAKKGAKIENAEAGTGIQSGTPTSPRAAPALTRAVTSDNPPKASFDRPEDKGTGGGFISRMKSLKGGKRTRPEIKA